MMSTNYKLQIYKGIIHYLLEYTNYSLKNIAELSQSTLKNIKTIYSEDFIPPSFSSECHLVRLYQMILELHGNMDLDFTPIRN